MPAASAKRLPLEGIRVLGITAVWSGPSASMFLADWGAEVIRVESTKVFIPGTRGTIAHPTQDLVDSQRWWRYAYPDWEPGERPWNRYPMFQSHARNKRSMTVSLTDPEGLEILYDLAKTADVFIENHMPAVMDKLGITYERLREARPDVVMVRLPGFGLDGPYRNYRAYGTQMEAVSGHLWQWGHGDLDLSHRGGTYLADAATGLSAALAVVMALAHRRKTGQGQLIELSQVENLIGHLGDSLLDYQMTGRIQESVGNRHPFAAPHNVYRCEGEERWVVICVWTDQDWRALAKMIGHPELIDDPMFATGLARWRNQAELDSIIEAWTVQRDSIEAMNDLQQEGIPAGAVMNERDLYEDRQLDHRQFFQEINHADTGTHLYPGLMWKSESYANRFRSPPCRLGEHNPYVYRELLGVNERRYQDLEALGHIGDAPDASLP